MARIYNRKLAERIRKNREYLVKLVARSADISVSDFERTKSELHSFISRDEMTLLNAGYDDKGHKLPADV